MSTWNNIREYKNFHEITLLQVFWLLALVFISSCAYESRIPSSVRSALDKAGENRGELLEVIRHYSHDPEDSLKLEAAYFLIGNMPGHTFRKESDIFAPVFDSASTYRSLNGRKRFIARQIEQIRQEYPVAFYGDSLVEDLSHVTAGFLIENIDLAFKAYERMPLKLRSDFNTFLEHVLPYRSSSEPLEFGNRKKQFLTYQWVHEELQAGRPLQDVARSVLDSMALNLQIGNGYPGILSGSQIEQVRLGRCRDLVDYAVNAFRAIGIPASHNFTPHYGNHHNAGHDWLAIHQADRLIAIDVIDTNPLNELYKKVSLPKVYQYRYAARHDDLYSFTKDVTAAYKPANQIRVANRWGKNVTEDPAYLTVFDRTQGWVPVGRAERVAKDSVLFKDIAADIVYVAGYYDHSRTFQPLNYPFIVDDQQQVSYLNVESGLTIDSVALLRKYPPFFFRSYKRRLRRIEMVNALTFQASNTPSFDPHYDILDFNNFNSTHLRTIQLSYEGKYKYYRIKGIDSVWVWLATLRIAGEHDYDKIHTRNHWTRFNMDYLQDDDPLTYRGGRKFEVRYDFSRPVKVNTLEIQARNDDNHIRPGDTYELMYWDKSWRSLGSRVAADTLLVYEDVPEGALYWLRNHSRGTEEHVFTLTDQGKQFWPGISNY